jgi:hypothetical protein
MLSAYSLTVKALTASGCAAYCPICNHCGCSTNLAVYSADCRPSAVELHVAAAATWLLKVPMACIPARKAEQQGPVINPSQRLDMMMSALQCSMIDSSSILPALHDRPPHCHCVELEVPARLMQAENTATAAAAAAACSRLCCFQCYSDHNTQNSRPKWLLNIQRFI